MQAPERLSSIHPSQSQLSAMVLLGVHQQQLASPGALAPVGWHALQRSSEGK